MHDTTSSIHDGIMYSFLWLSYIPNSHFSFTLFAKTNSRYVIVFQICYVLWLRSFMTLLFCNETLHSWINQSILLICITCSQLWTIFIPSQSFHLIRSFYQQCLVWSLHVPHSNWIIKTSSCHHVLTRRVPLSKHYLVTMSL